MRFIRGTIVALLLGVLLFVGGVMALMAAIDLDGRVEEYQGPVLREAKALLGRNITFGGVQTRWWPRLGFDIQRVAVEAAPSGEDGAAGEVPLAAESISVDISWQEALLSLGQRVVISDITLRRPELTLRHEKGAPLTLRALLGAGTEGESKGAERDPRIAGYLHNVGFKRVAIEYGEIYFVDERLGEDAPPLEISHITFELHDLRLGQPLNIQLRASVSGSAENLRLGARSAALPAALPIESLPELRELHLVLDRVPLRDIARHLPPEFPADLESTALSTDVKLALSGGNLRVDGQGTVSSLVLRDGDVVGEPFDLRFSPWLRIAPGQDGAPMVVDMGRFELGIASMLMKVGGKLTLPTPEGGALAIRSYDWSAAKLQKVDISAPHVPLGALAAALPWLKRALPDGLNADGRGVLTLTLDGPSDALQTDFNLSLRGMELTVPGLLHKRAEDDLSLVVRGVLGPSKSRFDQLVLSLGAVALNSKGSVETRDGRSTFDLVARSNAFEIDKVARLVPAVQKGLPPGTKAGGKGSFSLSMKGDAARLDIDGRLELSDVDLKTKDARLEGQALAHVTVSGRRDDATVKGTLSFDDATLVVDEVINKPAGRAARLQLEGRKRKDTVQISELGLFLDGAALRGRGSVALGSETRARGMSLNLASTVIDVDRLVSTVGAFGKPPVAGGRLRFNAELTGDPLSYDDWGLRLKDSELVAGRSQLRGSVTIPKLGVPVPELRIEAPQVDFDQLLGNGERKQSSLALLAEALSGTNARATLRIDRGVIDAQPFGKLEAETTLSGGTVDFAKLRAQAFGGGINAAGSRFDFAAQKPGITLKAQLSGLDVRKLGAPRETGLGGRLSGKLAVEGSGLTWADWAASVKGTADGFIEGGELRGLSLLAGTGKPLIAALPFLRDGVDVELRDTGRSTFQRLALKLAIDEGKAVTRTPLQLKMREGALNAEGQIVLDDGQVALKGRMRLAPATVFKLTGNRVRLNAELPIPVMLSGSVGAPKLQSADVKEAAKTVTAAYAGP